MKQRKNQIIHDDSQTARDEKLAKLNEKIKNIQREIEILNANDDCIGLQVTNFETGEGFDLVHADKENMLALRRRQLEMLDRLVGMAEL